MDKIKAIYHVPLNGIEICKFLGFTHVNLCLWNGVGEQFYVSAHELGLHCVISSKMGEGPSLLEFLAGMESCPVCLINLPDEPNRKGIKPDAIRVIKNMLGNMGWQTIVTLADTHSYRGYENTATWIAFDNYELDAWHFFKLWIKIKLFQIKNKSQIIAVPAIKPEKILSQFFWWQKWIKPNGYYWYPWTCSQEGWSNKDIDELPNVQNDLKECNKYG